jgi:hypothetical protein
MADFKTVLVKNSVIADITDNQTIAVYSGASNNTYQQFKSISTSASSMVFSVQIPSESIVVDRKVLLKSQLTFTLTYSGVPTGIQAFNLGVTDALGPFPLASLMNTLSATINNTNVSVNLEDVFPALLRMNSTEELQLYNGMSPNMPDNLLNYSDGALTNNNVLSAFATQGFDKDLAPRGSFPVIATVSQYTSAGAYVSASPIVASTGNVVKVEITGTFCEPLFLSPFIFGNPEANSGGFVGLNTLNLTMNLNSGKRLFRTASPYTVDIALGSSSTSDPFSDTFLLFNFLSTQPTDMVPSRNVLPFYDFPRYISSNNNTTIASGKSTDITSNNIQLNQLPDKFIIMVRKQASSLTIQDTDSFFTINSISVNLNNQSGLLSSATQNALWRISLDNGLQMSWSEWSGKAFASDTSTGVGKTINTCGSILVLNPAMDLSLPPFLSSSSVGQFNFQFNINVTNNYSSSVQPEVCVICCNSGLFTTQAGTSQISSGLLQKQMVLDAQEKSSAVISSAEYGRMVGGKLSQMNGSSLKKIAKRFFGQHKQQQSGGAISGGSMSGGGGGDKLSKYY